MHDVAHPGGPGGRDGGGGLVRADALGEQEESLDAGEGGRQGGGFLQVADGALGAVGQSGGAGGVADEET